jgi:hypothetical protein
MRLGASRMLSMRLLPDWTRRAQDALNATLNRWGEENRGISHCDFYLMGLEKAEK